MPIRDTSLLEAALVGYEMQLAALEAQIAEIQGHLGVRGRGRPPAATTNHQPGRRKRRRMSTAARARIAAAQKKRWAAFRKKQAA